MALSQTSLELNTLTVETLFNRGPLLSTSQAYIPIISSIGPIYTNNNQYTDNQHLHWGSNQGGDCGCGYQYIGNGGFYQWFNLPVSTIYYNFFYNYPKPDVLLKPANDVLVTSENLSSSLHYTTDTVDIFNSTNYSVLLILSSIDISTVSSYTNSFSFDYSTSIGIFNTITNQLYNDLPGLQITSTTFRTQEFSQNASTLIIIASNYYINGPRFIGPGLSSLSTAAGDPNNISTLKGYTTVLETTLNDSSQLIPAFRERRLSLTDSVNNLYTRLETGSSFSTLYYQSNSSFFNYISSLSSPSSFFDTYINSFSSFISTDIGAYIIPTNDPFISTGSTLISILNSSFYSTLISSISSTTLKIPLSSFSTSIQPIIQSNTNQVTRNNYIPGLSSIYIRFSTVLKPVFDPLFVSTNLYGYQYISSIALDPISTLSTTIQNDIQTPIINTLTYLNSTMSTLFSTIQFSASSIISQTLPYITAPGVSSISSFFGLEIDNAKLDYTNRTLSVIIPFNNYLSNVNSIPGLSSLYLVGSTANANMAFQSTYLFNFTNSIYPPFETNFFYSSGTVNYTNLSTSIYSSITKYISAGVNAYSTSLFAYSNISSGFTSNILYIQRFGNIIVSPTIYFTSLVQSNTADILNNILSSNSYFIPLQVIPDYSTSIRSFPPGIIPHDGDQYLLRSTFFKTLTTSSLFFQNFTNNLNTLLIGTSSSTVALNIDGGVSINPYSILTNYFLIGNSNPFIYPINTSNILLNDPYEFTNNGGLVQNNGGQPSQQQSGTPSYNLNNVFGATLFENNMILTGYNSVHNDYRSQILPLNQSEISLFNPYIDPSFLSPISSSFEFYSTPLGYVSGDTVDQAFDPSIGDIQSFYVAPYYFHSQIAYNFTNSSDRMNYIMYTSNIYSTIYSQVALPPSGSYISLGPITSFTGNGSYYLLTATSNTHNNYFSNYWYPTSTDTYYTLFITSNLDFANVQENQFYIPLINDPPVELHDGLWTGKNWVVAGNGVYTSSDALSWNQVLPTSTERLLQYRSMDFNGQDILLAHVSSSPVYIEFLKSSDYGNTWSTLSYFSLPSGHPPMYTDIAIRSSIIYSVNIKWAFNTWNAYINSVDSVYNHLITSSDGGITWSDTRIYSDSVLNSVPDRDTLNILFQPIQNIRPNIELPNFHIYARDDPVRNPTAHTLSARFSSIIFNEGDLTIKRRYNSLLTGIMGINTIYPTYALDIGIGDARKPSGTQWINPSDQRIKTGIHDASISRILNEIPKIQLVQYKWKDSYRLQHGLTTEPTLGFISQQVESVYPSSVHISEESGFTDFRTLDTDQLFKAKFGLTQHLLARTSTLQSRIDNLLGR